MRALLHRARTLAVLALLACTPIANDYLFKFLGPGPHGPMPWA